MAKSANVKQSAAYALKRADCQSVGIAQCRRANKLHAQRKGGVYIIPPRKGIMDEEKISDTIEKIIEFFSECEIGYKAAYEEVGIEDKRSQDLLHMIEFEPNNKERSKIATRLRECRISRRQNKDMVEVLEPIHEFVTDPRHTKTLNMMKELLGAVRKAEQRHENRVYIPRIEGDILREN